MRKNSGGRITIRSQNGRESAGRTRRPKSGVRRAREGSGGHGIGELDGLPGISVVESFVFGLLSMLGAFGGVP